MTRLIRNKAKIFIISQAHASFSLCKILNFPPKCISVLYQLPLIFSFRISHHSTEPPHKNTVLWCQGCPRPLRQCRGHQRLLAKAGNSKFYRVRCLFQTRKFFPAFGKLEASLVRFLATSSSPALANEGLFELA